MHEGGGRALAHVPADLLPIFIALGVRAEGSVMFWNKVYEGALGWTSELAKFGAEAVPCDPHRVITVGGRPLAPATVESPYIIRVAIALLMIAASIEGRSTILNAEPIRRGPPALRREPDGARRGGRLGRGGGRTGADAGLTSPRGARLRA